MELKQFNKLLSKEPGYRLKQAKKVLFQDLIVKWEEATALPLSLRNELDSKCPINVFEKSVISKDRRTVKTLILLKDGLKVETVLMRHQDKRNTVCVSSQIGCSLRCNFCATGKMGFKRNLDKWEIVEQVLHFARYLNKYKEKVTNVVFMGMGEPFLNYQNVIEAIRILNDKDGLNLGARHFSISTAGIVEGIEKLAKEKLQINLAVSLHASNDPLRTRLMPINKTYSIQTVLSAVNDYIAKTRRRVMFEYIIIRDLNDSEEDARALAKLMKEHLYFVNLIAYNQTETFKPSTSSRIKKFKEILKSEGIAVTQRYRFGRDIKGACGQLATEKKKKL